MVSIAIFKGLRWNRDPRPGTQWDPKPGTQNKLENRGQIFFMRTMSINLNKLSMFWKLNKILIKRLASSFTFFQNWVVIRSRKKNNNMKCRVSFYTNINDYFIIFTFLSTIYNFSCYLLFSFYLYSRTWLSERKKIKITRINEKICFLIFVHVSQ